jgi:hypothetical protein
LGQLLCRIQVGLALVPLLWFTWNALTSRTHFDLEKDAVSVRTDSMILKKKRRWIRGDVDQVFVEGRRRKYREHDSYLNRRVTRERIDYSLILKTKSGDEAELCSRIFRPDEALYLEQEIENHLGISDVKANRGPNR